MCDSLVKPFGKRQPCNTCPYRKDVPLKHWAVEEFIKLLESEADYMGAVFMCHKKDDNICMGWLINQDERIIPSIALRIILIKHKITRKYLDSLSCKSEMYKTVIEMCKANYPDKFNNIPNE